MKLNSRFACALSLVLMACGGSAEEASSGDPQAVTVESTDVAYSADVFTSGFVAHRTIQITAKVGTDTAKSTRPFIAVGEKELYGLGGDRGRSLRFGPEAEPTVYLEFNTPTDDPQSLSLSCCIGNSNPALVDGKFGDPTTDAAKIMDMGAKGFYKIGKLVNVSAGPLVFEPNVSLKISQIQLDPGYSLSASRRNDRGDRVITIEATTKPALITEEPHNLR